MSHVSHLQFGTCALIFLPSSLISSQLDLCRMDGYQRVYEPNELSDAFRTNYHHLERLVREAVTNVTDLTIFVRLGDELDEYLNLVNEVSLLLAFVNKIVIT